MCLLYSILCFLFQIIFGIAEVVLLLPPKDPEFGLTIVLLIAMMVVCVLVHILVGGVNIQRTFKNFILYSSSF